MRFGLEPRIHKILDLTHDVVPIAQVMEQTGCPRPVLDQLTRAGIFYIEKDKILNLAIRTEPPSI
jgi:hypothetical protein